MKQCFRFSHTLESDFSGEPWRLLVLLSVAFALDSSDRVCNQTEDSKKQKFLESIAGKYAHFSVVAYHEQMGRTDFRSLVIAYGFTTLDYENGSLVATDRYCRSVHKSNQPFLASLSDQATSSILPVPTKVEVGEDDEGFYIWRPESPTALGIKLENPKIESLPKDPNDHRIFDQDQDGRPGVTVQIKMFGWLNCEIYMIRREIFAYKLRLKPERTLEGYVKDTSEQLVIGAWPWFLNRESDPLQHTDLSKSPMVLVPVDDTYDCDRLLEERSTLLPPDPEVWT